jgi:hypothetical protein
MNKNWKIKVYPKTGSLKKEKQIYWNKKHMIRQDHMINQVAV